MLKRHPIANRKLMAIIRMAPKLEQAFCAPRSKLPLVVYAQAQRKGRESRPSTLAFLTLEPRYLQSSGRGRRECPLVFTFGLLGGGGKLLSFREVAAGAAFLPELCRYRLGNGAGFLGASRR